MKILLVEDSATLRHAMSQYISEAGHTPLLATSGEAALQLLEDTPVDLIIMDVEMPGLNGFETTRLIREWLGGYWIPIIFVTGKNEDESYREGIEAGGDDYLIKPVSPVIIKAKIRAMARIAEMRDQLSHLNAELEALSQLDSLTQIYNRRTFNERAEQQWLLAIRHQTPISVLMIDVDHFKPYNDHYGHPAGDRCLKQISRALKSCLHRPADVLGRYGGEEFIALLPDTDRAGAKRVAECLNDAIRELDLEHRFSPSGDRVTVSIGGATCNHSMGHSLEEVIKCADRALYKSKHNGRDRATVEEVAAHKTLLIGVRCPELLLSATGPLQEHCNILTADTPEECLEIAANVYPDLIIADAETAFYNDGHVCRQLARNPQTAATPLLVLTDSDQPEAFPPADCPNAQGWLQHPFSASELRTKVQLMLD
ncbi:diguanylate cyclase [Marinimicrobium sp. C2-29]|uniref:diguanylate cyclase n=1 Tax=Marinimicrobium sp. C2-29 TaxID=3139825 RepID=UPI0031389CA5